MRRLAIRFLIFSMLVISVLGVNHPVTAADDVFYTSTPDSLAIFLNNIAYAEDTIRLPGGSDVQIVLPATVYADTLVLYQNDTRVLNYRMKQGDGQILLKWELGDSEEFYTVRLTYLMYGLAWTPKYDMWIQDAENVQFDFFAQISNSLLELDDVAVKLIAGRVDTSQVMSGVTTITTNQYIAGYAEIPTDQLTLNGTSSIQHIYDAGSLSAEPGDSIFLALSQNSLAARRLYLWNASSDNQVTVIYKVKNESELPFAEGLVRSYENGLFLGSDFVEVTPIGAEGSVTVGNLQNVRVFRDETRTSLGGNDYDEDEKVEVSMSLSNFGDETVTIEVVDSYTYTANNFTFSRDAEMQAGNLLRWEIEIKAGETVEITYEYRD